MKKFLKYIVWITITIIKNIAKIIAILGATGEFALYGLDLIFAFGATAAWVRMVSSAVLDIIVANLHPALIILSCIIYRRLASLIWPTVIKTKYNLYSQTNYHLFQ